MTIYEEAAIVAANMQKYGGTFAARIGAALEHADIKNTQKIKNAWPDLWSVYLNWGK